MKGRCECPYCSTADVLLNYNELLNGAAIAEDDPREILSKISLPPAIQVRVNHGNLKRDYKHELNWLPKFVGDNGGIDTRHVLQFTIADMPTLRINKATRPAPVEQRAVAL